MQPASNPPKRILNVVDLSHMQKDPPPYDPPHHRMVYDMTRGGNVVFCRKPRSIDGIVIHQTGCWFGVSKALLKEMGGNYVAAKHRRALNVAAHMTAFDTGFAVLAHPLDWYVYHANSLCARSLGLEVEGAFPGVMSKGKYLTPKLIQAACDGLEYLVDRGRSMGMPLKFIWAHRQSSPSKENDPGEEIWRKIVLGFAVPKLRLQVQNDYASGGKPIPESWREPQGVA